MIRAKRHGANTEKQKHFYGSKIKNKQTGNKQNRLYFIFVKR